MPRAPRPSIRAVAALAGVSPTTVSHALSGTRRGAGRDAGTRDPCGGRARLHAQSPRERPAAAADRRDRTRERPHRHDAVRRPDRAGGAGCGAGAGRGADGRRHRGRRRARGGSSSERCSITASTASCSPACRIRRWSGRRRSARRRRSSSTGCRPTAGGCRRSPPTSGESRRRRSSTWSPRATAGSRWPPRPMTHRRPAGGDGVPRGARRRPDSPRSGLERGTIRRPAAAVPPVVGSSIAQRRNARQRCSASTTRWRWASTRRHPPSGSRCRADCSVVGVDDLEIVADALEPRAHDDAPCRIARWVDGA